MHSDPSKYRDFQRKSPDLSTGAKAGDLGFECRENTRNRTENHGILAAGGSKRGSNRPCGLSRAFEPVKCRLICLFWLAVVAAVVWIAAIMFSAYHQLASAREYERQTDAAVKAAAAGDYETAHRIQEDSAPTMRASFPPDQQPKR